MTGGPHISSAPLPVIVGWMEDTGVDLHQTTGTHVSVQKRATAIRIPVTVPAGKAGESIRIDASFNRLSFPDGGGLGLG